LDPAAQESDHGKNVFAKFRIEIVKKEKFENR
jgi:hypothetical protein